MPRPSRFLLLLALVVIIAAMSVWLSATRSYTPPITDQRGRIQTSSVATLEKIRLGGQEQWLLTRGSDSANPVLLFLHGGPGMPMMYLAHAFQHGLEQKFVVVQWDQRGSGKSYDPHIPPSAMTTSRLIDDAVELIDTLRIRFHQPKVFIAGHSWGSYLGMRVITEHPGLVHAYVGIGQVVDPERAHSVTDSFLRAEAVKRNRPEALRELNEYGGAVREKWLFRFGGELAGATSMWPLLRTGLAAPEYSLRDALNIPKGVAFTHRYIHFGMDDGALIKSTPRVTVPVYFFAGLHDYNTPSSLVQTYYEQIEAPSKKIIWFEQSAHFPFLEETELFTRCMIDSVLMKTDLQGGVPEVEEFVRKVHK